MISRRGAWKVCVWSTVALVDIIIQYEVLLIGSGNSEYPWVFTVLRTERKMARRFAKVSEEKNVAMN